jgi:hypothetical protein
MIAVILAAARKQRDALEAQLPERGIKGVTHAGAATRGAVWAIAEIESVHKI